MIALTWILSIVGVLGIGGAIAAAIIAPAVVIPLLQRTIEWILGCKRCLFALAFVIAMLAAFWSGHYKAQIACREANVAAALRNQQLDLDIAHRAMEAETTLIKSIEDKASDREKNDDKYIATLADRPVCALDDDDIAGLSNHQSGTSDKKPAKRTK